MAVTGFKYAATITSETPGATAWVNPSNAGADDNTYTTQTGAKSTTYQFLKAVNYGFTTTDIPTGSTINGIEVVIGKYCPSESPIQDYQVYIIKGGTPGTTNYALAGGWDTYETAYTYGGSTSLWGLSWAVADITGATFGLKFQLSIGKNQIAYIDYIKIRVHYTESETTARRIFII